MEDVAVDDMTAQEARANIEIKMPFAHKQSFCFNGNEQVGSVSKNLAEEKRKQTRSKAKTNTA